MKLSYAIAVLLAVILGKTAGADAGSYTFTPIDFPGSVASWAGEVNDAGVVAGGYDDGVTTHGYIYDVNDADGDGYAFNTFDHPGYGFSFSVGLNDSGYIVGGYRDGGVTHGYIYDGSSFTTFDFPGAVSSIVTDINDSATTIVGKYFDGAMLHGYVFEGSSFSPVVGVFSTFDYTDLPGADSWVGGTNEAGVLVGAFKSGTDFHGYVYEDGAFTVFDHPTASSSSALGINNSGTIVGQFFDGSTNRGYIAEPIAVPAMGLGGHAALVLLLVGGTLRWQPGGAGRYESL